MSNPAPPAPSGLPPGMPAGLGPLLASVDTLAKSQLVMHKDIASLTKVLRADYKENKKSKAERAKAAGLPGWAKAAAGERAALYRNDPRTKEAFEELEKIEKTAGDAVDRLDGAMAVWERLSTKQETTRKRNEIAAAIQTGNIDKIIKNVSNVTKSMGAQEKKAALNAAKVNRQLDEQLKFSQAKIGLADAVTDRFGLIGKLFNGMKDKAAVDIKGIGENRGVINQELNKETKRGMYNDRIANGSTSRADQRLAGMANQRANHFRTGRPIMEPSSPGGSLLRRPPPRRRTTSINDGIVTKDGQVIKTHPDDNIMAFKGLLGGKNGSQQDKLWSKKATNPNPKAKDVISKSPEFIATPFLYLGSLLTGVGSGKKSVAGTEDDQSDDGIGGIFDFLGDLFGFGGGKKKKGKGKGKGKPKVRKGKGKAGAGGGIGEMIGSFIGGILDGIAGGLAAFAAPEVILGSVVFAGLAVALGFALNLLAPALEALAPVLIKVADVIGNVFMKAIEKTPEIIKAIGDAIKGIVGSIGDVIVNTIKAVTGSVVELSKINGAALLATGAGIASIAGGLVLFAGAKMVDALSGITKLFAADPVSQFKAFADIADPLSIAAQAIKMLADSIVIMNNIDMGKATSQVKLLGDALKNSSLVDSLSKLQSASGPNISVPGTKTASTSEKKGQDGGPPPKDEMLETVKGIYNLLSNPKSKGGFGDILSGAVGAVN